ncbi:hypothetical protein [Streptomyces sp. NRRL S-87]|uniref:hypothetical protein n=1 Tax=Streptomyces sp. NRRL S-87 TaxID=1463920 RepID=UPI000A4FAB6E|nr:hypothetical protein [Streptomyces sp. NRRL S-87]
MTAKTYRFSVLKLLIRIQHFRLPRKRNVLIPLLGLYVTLMVTAQSAWAQDIAPVGVGDLLPSPQLKHTGPDTLYEKYSNPLLFTLDSDYGMWDVFDPILELPADICMALTATIGSACVMIVQWIFNLTTIPEVEGSIAKSIEAASGTLTNTLLPSAMMVGALVAWAQHRKAAGSALGQLGWVAVSTIFSLSLLLSPSTWISGIDNVRTIGSSIAMNAADAGIGDGTKEPIDLGTTPSWGSNERDNMLRKSGDAVWRTFVVTPWCVADFGSKDACKKHGKDLLEQGVWKGKRKEWLQKNVTKDSVGEDSVTWRQGHTPVGRIMVTIPALICVIIFAALLLALAFASLASLLGALMLLFSGVIFACLWVIPGRPRTWGVRYFDTLLGFALQSAISTMVLGAVMVIETAAAKAFGSLGYAAVGGLSIAAALVAFKFRGIMESIVGVTGMTSPAAALGGLLAARGAAKAGWGLTKAAGRGLVAMHAPRMPRLPRFPRRGGGGGGAGDGGGVPQLPGGGSPGALAGSRRPMPPLPTGHSGAASLPGGNSRTAVGPLTSRPELPASSAPATGRSVADGPANALPAGRRPMEVTAGASRPELPAGSSAQTVGARRNGSAARGQATASRSADAAAGRPATVAGGTRTTAAQAAPQPAQVAAGRPSPALRPEAGEQANFAFRSAPEPGRPAPKLIRHKVISSTPNRPPAAGGSRGPNPVRPETPGRTARTTGRRMAVPGMRSRRSQ